MKQKKLLLIVNPCSGKAKMGSSLLSVVQIFSNANYTVTVYPTKDRTDATLRLNKVKTRDYDLIVVCGGDGTLNEAITGLMNSGADIPIGYIPAGTLNEWSSSLGIARTIKKAAADIVSGREITLDIGRFGDRYFTYTASFGALTSVSYSTPQSVKNTLGQAAYVFEGIKSLAAIKASHIDLEVDGESFSGDYLFGAVSNSLSMGGVIKFDRAEVALNDGEFEVLLIEKPTNVLKFQSLIDGILKHDFNREGMRFFHAKSVKFCHTEPLDWTLDGEHAVTKGEIEIKNVHQAVRFIVPDKKNINTTETEL